MTSSEASPCTGWVVSSIPPVRGKEKTGSSSESFGAAIDPYAISKLEMQCIRAEEALGENHLAEWDLWTGTKMRGSRQIISYIKKWIHV